MDGGINQVGAAENSADANVWGKVDVQHSLFGGGGDGAAVGANEHQRDAQHDVLAVFAGGAGAKLSAKAHGCHVANQDGRAIALGQDDAADLLEPVDSAGDADEIALALVLDDACAGVG